MLIAQALSLPLGKAFLWRYISAIGAGIGGVLLFSGFLLDRVERRVKSPSEEDDSGAGSGSGQLGGARGGTSRGDEGDETGSEERPLLGCEFW